LDTSAELLRLYGAASRLEPAAFERRSIRRLGRLVGFDGAVWGHGRAVAGQARVRIEHAALLDRPARMLDDYDRLPADPVSIRFLEEPQALQRVDVRQHYRGRALEPVRDYLIAYDVGHLMIQGCVDAGTGRLSWITAYRSPEDPPFTIDEARRFSGLVKHWIQAREICRLTRQEHSQSGADAMGFGGPSVIPNGSAGSVQQSLVTARQREVLTLLAVGLSYREIASTLGLSVQTVKGYLHDAYLRLGAGNKAEAIFEARLLGLLH
jgi:DNA-binding CsgD family transcriptional regulator